MFAIARRSLFLSVALGSSFFAGCTPFAGDDVVAGKVDVIRQAGSQSPVKGIAAISGTYSATCEGHSEGEKWSVGVESSASLPYAELVVRKNDSDCALALTEIATDGDSFLADAPIALGVSFSHKPRRFASSLSSNELFANAHLDSLSFAADFTISLSVSTKPSDVESGEKTSEYATHSASVSVANVPAPSYSFDLSSFSLVTDANDAVVSTSGHAQLTEGSTAGQSYAIYDGTLTAASAPSTIAAAMAAASVSGPLSGLTSLQIPHSQFDVEGKSLSTSIVRTVILRNVDETSKVASYQLIVVTFSKPAVP